MEYMENGIYKIFDILIGAVSVGVVRCARSNVIFSIVLYVFQIDTRVRKSIVKDCALCELWTVVHSVCARNYQMSLCF